MIIERIVHFFRCNSWSPPIPPRPGVEVEVHQENIKNKRIISFPGLFQRFGVIIFYTHQLQYPTSIFDS